MLNWPAIVHFADDAELLFIKDQASWQRETDPSAFKVNPDDRVIDVTGAVYQIQTGPDAAIQLQREQQPISLIDLLGLIKAHAAEKGSCCVAKLYAPSLVDAFNMLEAMRDDG